jgi:hypothetical protein
VEFQVFVAVGKSFLAANENKRLISSYELSELSGLKKVKKKKKKNCKLCQIFFSGVKAE